MALFCVATDSGCDLPRKLLREHEIYPMMMRYTFGEEVYTDTMEDTDSVRFYERMRNDEIPHTSQANVAEHCAFWETLLPLKLPILHIAMGSGISGTYRNAVLAREQFLREHPETELYLIDSTLASTGYGMLALEAARMRDEGKTPSECALFLEVHKINVNTYYTTSDLTYLYRSGRVSKTGMVIAHTLGICPILNLDKEGHLIVTEKVRGVRATDRRIQKIVEQLSVDPQNQTLFICHSDIPEEARAFGEMLKNALGFRDVYYTYIGPTIGTHSGPGLKAAFFFGKPRT